MAIISRDPEWALLIGVMALGLYWYTPFRNKQQVRSPALLVTVSESGRWLPVVTESAAGQEGWQIESRSKLLPFALYIVLVSELTGRRQSLWVFPQQTSELSYRRLARIIFRQGIL